MQKYTPKRLAADMRKAAENDRKRKQKRMARYSLLWVWEFSKRVVLLCVAIYATENAYAMAAMWHFADFTYLGTLIEQTSDILRTCVFGYFIKAGLENAIKIYFTARSGGQAPEPAGPEPDNGEPPLYSEGGTDL